MLNAQRDVLAVVAEFSPTLLEDDSPISPDVYIRHLLAYLNASTSLDASVQISLYIFGPALGELAWTSESEAGDGGDGSALDASPPSAAGGAHAGILAALEKAEQVWSESAREPAADAGGDRGGDAAKAEPGADAGTEDPTKAGGDRSSALPAPRLSATLSRAVCRAAAQLRAQRRRRRPLGDPDEREAGEQARRRRELGLGVGGSAPRGRVLVVTLSEDPPDQAVALLNAAFAAQKLRLPVDSLLLGEAASSGSTLRQAALLTGGASVALGDPETFLQHLLTCFLGPSRGRTLLRPPAVGAVDSRAPCVDRPESVAIGHVCSVCLAVYGRPVPRCQVCGTGFGADGD